MTGQPWEVNGPLFFPKIPLSFFSGGGRLSAPSAPFLSAFRLSRSPFVESSSTMGTRHSQTIDKASLGPTVSRKESGQLLLCPGCTLARLPSDVWVSVVLPFLSLAELHSLRQGSQYLHSLISETTPYPLYLRLQRAFPALWRGLLSMARETAALPGLQPSEVTEEAQGTNTKGAAGLNERIYFKTADRRKRCFLHSGSSFKLSSPNSS